MLDLTVMSTWQQTSEALSSYKVKPVKLWLQFLLPAHCSPTYFRALKTHRKRNLFQEKHKQVYQFLCTRKKNIFHDELNENNSCLAVLKPIVFFFFCFSMTNMKLTCIRKKNSQTSLSHQRKCRIFLPALAPYGLSEERVCRHFIIHDGHSCLRNYALNNHFKV